MPPAACMHTRTQIRAVVFAASYYQLTTRLRHFTLHAGICRYDIIMKVLGVCLYYWKWCAAACIFTYCVDCLPSVLLCLLSVSLGQQPQLYLFGSCGSACQPTSHAMPYDRIRSDRNRRRTSMNDRPHAY